LREKHDSDHLATLFANYPKWEYSEAGKSRELIRILLNLQSSIATYSIL
jgi:hypothetical protein